jgi:hypothetical protein
MNQPVFLLLFCSNKRFKFSQKVLLLAHGAHFGIHEMLRSIPKTRPKGLKQFGIVNPPEADKRSAFHKSFSKSGQNRS